MTASWRLCSTHAKEDPIGVEAVEPAPVDLSKLDTRPHLSFSQLSVYQQCGTKYKLSYIDRVDREPQGSFLAGRAVHGAIQDSEGAGLWVPSGEVDETLEDPRVTELVRIFHHRFDTAVEESGGPDAIRWGGRGSTEHYKWWTKNGPFMLRRYVIARRGFDGMGWIGVQGGTEMRLSAEIAGRVVVGYIDQFLMRELDRETGETEPCIIDWSTGMIGKKDPQQFATYAGLVLRERQLVVTKALAVYLRTADPDKQIQPVAFAPLVPLLDELYGEAVEGIDAGYFPVRPNDYCGSCSVRKSCWHFKAANG